MRMLVSALISLWPSLASAQIVADWETLSLPATVEANDPDLFAVPGGAGIIWTDVEAGVPVVRLALPGDDGFGPMRTVVREPDLFVNYADRPTAAMLADGGLVALWLRRSGGSPYAYDALVSRSADAGANWQPGTRLHDDRSPDQHGFATLVPQPDGGLSAIWLDGRIHVDGGPMQLRGRTITASGMGPDEAIDEATCSCCQTDAARTAQGVVAVYRDRTPEDIRDISAVRLAEGRWSGTVSVHGDGWEISGCPVNGPAVDADGQTVAVAWFTAAADIPAVNLAWSRDGGASFGPPVRIDEGDPAGRVDVAILPDATALVSWVEWGEAGEAVMLCRAASGESCAAREIAFLNDQRGTVNFPALMVSGDMVWLAWNEPGGGITARRGRLLGP